MPVYVDDEGTPAQDAVLIERGMLRGFMNSRETAARLGIANTGSARAYGPTTSRWCACATPPSCPAAASSPR